MVARRCHHTDVAVDGEVVVLIVEAGDQDLSAGREVDALARRDRDLGRRNNVDRIAEDTGVRIGPPQHGSVGVVGRCSSSTCTA